MREFNHINTAGITLDQAKSVAFEAEKTRNFSPEIHGITIGLSSGTTGNTGIFLVNPKERARWVAAILDRVLGFTLTKRKVAFFLRANSNLYESAKSSLLEFRFFDICLPFEQHFDHLADFQPDIIVGQPSVLRQIAEGIQAKAIQIQPRKIISVAEVLYPQDRVFFEKVFGIRIDEVYQCTEGFLAASCPAGKLHVNEDFIILEKKFIDEDKTRFHPVITDLLRYTQPVIRYELNDIIVAADGCSCNRPGFPIDYIEGRADDCWHFWSDKGEKVTVFPDIIRRAILRASDQIQQYVAWQSGEKHIGVFFEADTESQPQEIRKAIIREIQDALARLDISGTSIIFKEQYRHEAGSKFRRIRNEYHPKSKDYRHG